MLYFWEFLKYKVCAPIGEWICSFFWRLPLEPRFKQKEKLHPMEFSASEYMGRLEKTSLEILEEKEPI